MNQRHSQPETLVGHVDCQVQKMATRQDEVEGNIAAAPLADYALVQRCVAGEVGAWEELYAQCHDPLLALIRRMLGPGKSDPNLVDEIAARVWYALVADDGQLLTRYDPEKGTRIITFMRAVAKDLMGRHFRTERRRRYRELKSLQHTRRQHAANNESFASFYSVGEFLGTLSPKERQFADAHLLGEASDNGNGDGQEDGGLHSLSDFWQLSCRVHRKLLQFLNR